MGKSLTSSQVLRSENFETPCNIKGICDDFLLHIQKDLICPDTYEFFDTM